MPRLAPGMLGVLRRIVHGQPGAIVSERLGAISLYEYSPVLAFISKTAPNSCSSECRSGFSGQPGILAAVPASLRKLSAASRPAARRASAPSLALFSRGSSNEARAFNKKKFVWLESTFYERNTAKTETNGEWYTPRAPAATPRAQVRLERRSCNVLPSSAVKALRFPALCPQSALSRSRNMNHTRTKC